eukprot:m51a1_g3609 hypothetical protein (110) ;mRNA; f:54183-54734
MAQADNMYDDVLGSISTRDAAIEDLRKQLGESEAARKQRAEDVERMRQRCETLERNISALFETAKHEIQRKNDEIAALRKELEAVRRGRRAAGGSPSAAAAPAAPEQPQ